MTSGFVVKMACGFIIRSFGKQTFVANRSCEAKYIALKETYREGGRFLKMILFMFKPWQNISDIDIFTSIQSRMSHYDNEALYDRRCAKTMLKILSDT